MTRLFLIRHGQTAWNKKKRYQGQTNISLTQEGRKQAQAIANAFKETRIDLLFSSSLKRARQTALIISKKMGTKPVWDPRLQELSFGAWEGQTAKELSGKKDPAFLKWSQGRFVTPPGGESLASLRKRIRAFIKDFVEPAKDKHIAVVSHAGPIKVMIFELLGFPLRSLWSVQIDPASISVLSFHKHFVQLNYLNRVISAAHPAGEVFRK